MRWMAKSSSTLPLQTMAPRSVAAIAFSFPVIKRSNNALSVRMVQSAAAVS
jgi:hypothetical protein